MGALPKTDGLKRPLTFYGHTIHDHCLRRPFYERGQVSPARSTTTARKAGHCLYKLGCKGPTTYNACASLKWETGIVLPGPVGPPVPRLLGAETSGTAGGFYQGQSAPLDRPTAAAVGIAAGAGIALGRRPGRGQRRQEAEGRKSGKGGVGGRHGLDGHPSNSSAGRSSTIVAARSSSAG
ncbi:MAG: hypothetical protein M0C28_47825 [Candidatus Moduliflexus flocculans]|nr:hypothetical protein [Candidatus Moduliflexus flocculans]